MKKTIIVKNSKSKIKVYNNYIEIINMNENRVIGIRNIRELYLNQQIEISPSKFLKLLQEFKIFFINHHGKILGKIENIP